MVQAGSQLVAVFAHRNDVSDVREMVSKLVVATLGNPSAVDVEVSLGSVRVFIVFNQGGLSNIDGLANGLVAEGAQLTLAIDKRSVFLASEKLRGARAIDIRFCAIF